MLFPKMYRETAANGHTMLIRCWPDAGPCHYTALLWRLRVFYRLRRVGRVVYSPGDIILPDLVGPGVRLMTGWDNWSGYHLLAEDEAGDRLLEQFAGGRGKPVIPATRGGEVYPRGHQG